MTKFPLNTMLAVAAFGAIELGLHAANPRLGLDPSSLRPIGEFRFDSASFVPVQPAPVPSEISALAVPDPEAPGWSPESAANLTLESRFLFDQSGALDHFYAALQGLARGERDHPVRIVHYGDSPTTADLITGDARELLQDRFGDGGSGFVLIAKPWAWYGHHGVDVDGNGWQIDTAVGSMREAAYGLGGAIFTGQDGASTTIRLDSGNSTSIEVEYMQHPGGGSLSVSANGVLVGSVSTAGDAGKNGAASVALPGGTKVVQLRVSGGSVQVFGVALASGTRGLTYDSIGLNGASTTVMSRAFNPANWADALQHRNPDLVIINYGTNESGFPGYVDKQYEGELRRAIARVRAALPQASILVMSPMDRGTKADGDAIITMPAIPRIVAIQQRVSGELGCGFFDTYDAMGGNGTIAKWYDGQPRMVAADLIHPSPQGARIVARLLTSQLLIGYQRYMQRHPAGQPPNVTASVQSGTASARMDRAEDKPEGGR
jgi:lysophospholipase L1-like esterase